MKHEHGWMIWRSNIHFRDEDHKEYIVDVYRCDCGAGKSFKTPKELFDKGLKVLDVR